MTAPRTSTTHELQTLLASRNAFVVLESAEEERLDKMVLDAAAALSKSVFFWSLTHGLRRSDQAGQINGMTVDPGKLLQHVGEMTLPAVYVAHDLAPQLGDAITQRMLRETLPKLAAAGATLVITGDPVDLPEAIDADAVRAPVRPPDADELRSVIEAVVAATGAQAEAGAVDAATGALSGLTRNQARQAVAAVLVDGPLTVADADTLMAGKVRQIAVGGLLEFYPAQDNDAVLEGLAGLKSWLDRARLSSRPEAQAMNLTPPRGVLLTGVPGCGKSLAAKHIARDWQRPLLKLDAGCLYDKYIGETEKNLRASLDMAETLAPIVLWIDEIEKGLSTGGSDEGGAVGRRMLGTFLSWLQEHRADIFVVATSNDLTQLPPELSRKGRFDEIFFIDLPNEAERVAIFTAQLRRRNQDPAAYDVAALSAAADGFSGAEIEQAVVAGLLRSLQSGQPPATAALMQELIATVPLSRSRPEEVARIRARAAEFVPAA